MSELAKLIVLSLSMLAFFALLFYAVARVHGMTWREQFGGLAHECRMAVVEVACLVIPTRRYQRILVDRHLELCAKVSGSATVLQMARRMSTAQAGIRPSPDAVTEAADRHADAVELLRDFLRDPSDEDISQLARGFSFVRYGGVVDAVELQRFFEREKAAAECASDQDIIGHYRRLADFVAGRLEEACQPVAKPL